MNTVSVWISALRLQTLLLAVASILLAAGIAVSAQIFNPIIFSLSLSTALLLQILSNLANDYGDTRAGADNENRVGPLRSMQIGLISPNSMKKAILLTILLTLFSGMSLLLVALGNDLYSWILFSLLGLLAITAAVTYTMGKLPYGYHAMGDVAVFLFFGLLGVIGGYYLYDLSFNWSLLLPASSIGLLSSAVLNINNMRDLRSDKVSNKKTLVVLFGRQKAFIYHLFLVFGALFLAVVYLFTLEKMQLWQFVFLLMLSPFIKSSLALAKAIKSDSHKGEVFNEQLKNTVLSSFVFSLLFVLVLIPQS